MLDLMAKNWWVHVVRGVCAILFGILAFVWPGPTVMALVFMFGIYAVADGIFNLVGAFRTRKVYSNWWVVALEGVVGILAGIIAFVWPGITALALLYVVSFWALATGVLEIAGAIELRRVLDDEWFYILSGIASIMFGFLLAVMPGVGILTLTWLIGGYAIVFGVLLIGLGIKLKNFENHQLPKNRKSGFRVVANDR